MTKKHVYKYSFGESCIFSEEYNSEQLAKTNDLFYNFYLKYIFNIKNFSNKIVSKYTVGHNKSFISNNNLLLRVSKEMKKYI